MKMKIWLAILGIVTGVFIIECVRKESMQGQTPEYVFSYAENQALDYPTTLGAYEFARLVEERTNGRIKINVQAEGALGYEKQVIEQLQYGGVDFSRVSISQLAEVIPKYNILQLPYLYTSSLHMWKVLDSQVGDDFLEETQESDLVGLSWYDAGARNFYNSVGPIEHLEDMKGLRIRVQESEMMADMAQALGAKAIPIVYDEVYGALEQKKIDGAENNWPSYESTGHYEVAKYYTIDEHTRVPEIQLCSRATWDKLSKADQKIIRECARESALYERNLWNEREKTSREIALKKGVVISVLSAEEKERFQKAVSGIYQKYCAEDLALIDEIIEMGR